MIQKILQVRYLVLLLCIGCNDQKHADLVIFGGKIYTVNDKAPLAEAIAISGDKITFVGNETEAKAFITKETTVIDLQGKILTPGFIEGHGHIMGVGYNELNLDLSSVKSFDEMIEKVKEK